MDFSLSEEQQAVRDLAEQIFQGQATVERVKACEAGEERVDRDLWRALADANLLSIAVPERDGGSGLGMIETCLVLEQQGRTVAPVPYWATIVCGALPIAELGTPAQRERWLPPIVGGTAFVSAAVAESGLNDPFRPGVRATPDGNGWRLDGMKPSVPAGHVADALLVPAATDDGVRVCLVESGAAGVSRESAETTDRSLVAHFTFDGAPAELLGDEASPDRALAWILDRALLGLAAIQVGVCEAALAMAAEYTNGRTQFERPLASFQGAQIRAADAYIDTEGIRVTTLQAAWKLDAGRDATTDVMVAKWWASEAGQHAVHNTQHLHGGMGADVDYPVHRYFLWGKQIEDTLGGASAQLARLGRALAEATTT
ncbi:MAG: acyl-CoA dehydrogenase family protein [Acidimicrobiia bacterium]